MTATTKAEKEAAEAAEAGPVGSPILTPPVAEATGRRVSRNELKYTVTLAHSVAVHTETGRVVGLTDAVDPLTGLPLDDYEVKQPGDEIDVLYGEGMSLVSGGYLQVDPYDLGAVDVLFSNPVNAPKKK